MKFQDKKTKLAVMMLPIGGAPALHQTYGQAFGEAVSGAAPVASHILEQIGLELIMLI